MKKLVSFISILFVGSMMFAQTSIIGTVKDANSQAIPGANIRVVGKAIGTTADFDGNFALKVMLELPFMIEISSIGYATVEIEITKNEQQVDVSLGEAATALDEVVISATRTPERILESPVTIERMDIRAIKNTSSPTFYDGLENLKGVDVNTNSLTFKSVNTRGFATFSNTRFMQLVDGMDNSSPALNFNLGNLLGMSELDVNTIELMPGASSALYGANAFNGILFMTSKNPFDYAGISAYGKTGLTVQEAAGDNQFVDAGIRMAYKFSDKFAAKASFSFLKGTDWYATNYENTNDLGLYIPGTRESDPNYNGQNIYGDEVATTLNFDTLAGLPAGTLGSQTVSRTGYEEKDLTDYDAESVKLDISLHYRPTGDDLEIIYNAKFGLGNTIYQGTNRYNINSFFMQQHKLEVRNNSFFVRAYFTGEAAGDSYDTRFAGINVNRMWKSDEDWFRQYATAYIGARTGQIPGLPAMDEYSASQLARSVAQTGVYLPGTPEFNNAFNTVIADPNLTTGAKFEDNSKLYNVDGNYDFHEQIQIFDLMVGGSFRQYSLNSHGVIFTDYDGPINYNEYGAYTQIQKKFLEDQFKFVGSIRYDKSENFQGKFTPRLSLIYTLGENKNQTIRASYQTGFRNPTTQDLYIGLDAGAAFLVGSASDNLDRFTTPALPVSATGQALGFGSTVELSGSDAYYNAFTLSSVLDGTYQKADFELVQPEEVTAYEIGYRISLPKISIDANAYYNKYKNFIGNKTVLVPYYGQADLSDITALPPELGGPTPTALIALNNGDYKPFQVYTNSEADISSYGGSIGVTSRIIGNFSIGVNYTFAKFEFDQASDPDYQAGFNTPENKFKFSIGNTELFKNFGFNIDYRWNDIYYWESTFANAKVNARNIVDAQINYTVPSIKSMFKVGGANIAGDEYYSAPGVGKIGSQYYISWTINP